MLNSTSLLGALTFKILCVTCIIYKRVTDDQASRLFFYLNKISREWPLLSNVTWDVNGAIFTDLTYGGFVFITAGLLLGHCFGELYYARKMETFFLIFGALAFIVVGSVELAAVEWVPDDLIVNAAVLGTLSLITAFVFIVDLLAAKTRRKKTKNIPKMHKVLDKTSQTEEKQGTNIKEIYANGDSNGYLHNNLNGFAKMEPKRIPPNSVKILPTDEFQIPITNSNQQYIGTISTAFSPVFTPSELKKPENKIKSTESFLKYEKGEIFRNDNRNGDVTRTPTPPGYAKVEMKNVPNNKVPPGFVMVPIDELNVNQLRRFEDKVEGGQRKLQSPTVTTTIRTPQGFYSEMDGRSSASPQTPRVARSSGSDESLITDVPRVSFKNGKNKRGKSPHEYSDESSPHEILTPMSKLEYPQKKYTREGRQYGRLNRGKSEDEIDSRAKPFLRNSLLRSSNYKDRPKQLVGDDERRLDFGYHEDFSSLDSRRIANDLKHLKEATSASIDLAELEKENKKLKEYLKKEQDEKYQLKTDLKLKNVEQKLAELDDRKNLERRILELEQLRHELKLAKGFHDRDEEKRIEKRIKEMEDEKDRRMSEREELYFGVVDLTKSQKEGSPDTKPKMKDLEEYLKTEITKRGVQETNKMLKEKTKEEEEIKKVIDDGFQFLDDERKHKTNGILKKSHQELSAPDLTKIYQKQLEKQSSRTGVIDTTANQRHESAEKFPRAKTPSPQHKLSDSDESSKQESASFRSEAHFWLSSEHDDDIPDEIPRIDTPSSPRDPGFVLHQAKEWEQKTSPMERFGYSAQKAQQLKVDKMPEKDGSKIVLQYDDETKIPQRIIEFIEFEEGSRGNQTRNQREEFEDKNQQGRRSGMLVRKVDFPDNVTVREIRNVPSAGSTSTWKKWLQPKPKLSTSRSNPA